MININWLKENGICETFKAGSMIPNPVKAPADKKAMYILISGSIEIISKNTSGQSSSQVLSSGDVFCGYEFFNEAGDNEYRAREDSTVYILTRETFDELSWSQPDIIFEILRSAFKSSQAVYQTPPQIQPQAQPQKKPVAADEKKPNVKPPSKTVTAVTAGLPADFTLPGHKLYDTYFPMNTKLVYPKEYTCPVCKRKFTDFRIFNTKLVEIAPMRYDFRKSYADFIIEWYEVLTCSHCLFSAFHNYFTDPKPIKIPAIEDKLTAARADVPINFNAVRDINHVFTMHYLALLCCDGFPTLGKQLYAKVLSSISWLYEDVEDKEMEKLAAAKAAEAFLEAHNAGNLTPAQDQTACMSIAAMQHRAGIDNNLKKYLYLAKSNKMGDKSIATLAEAFWTELGLGDYEE